MREEGVRRVVAHEPIQRGMRCDGVELHGSGRRKHEFHAIDIEFPIGKAECVAGEEGIALLVEDAVVVTRVSGRIEKQQRSAVEIQPEFIRRLDDPACIYRVDIPVHALEFRFAVDGHGAGDKARRICHMAGSTRMHHQFGVREMAHEFPRAPRMIEMDMSDKHVCHICGSQILFLQHFQYAGNGR